MQELISTPKNSGTGFYADVVAALRADAMMRRLGFQHDDIEWYGKGADHRDLMQVTRTDGWMIPADDASEIGYQGVWVHYESCRPGHWCIHCELYPRLSPRQKAMARNYDDLLDLKKEITDQIRQFGDEHDWPGRFGAHLKRARMDTRDPSSLIVWTFDLGLNERCTAAEFTQRVLPVIEGTAQVMDEFLIPLARS
jgi:hypothetical protein